MKEHYEGLDISRYHLAAEDYACAAIVENCLEHMTKAEAKKSLDSIVNNKAIHAQFDLAKLGELVDRAVGLAGRGIVSLHSEDGSLECALPTVKRLAAGIDGRRYVANVPGRFLDFIEDWYWAIR